MNTPLRIEITDSAQAQISTAAAWWAENRPAAPDAIRDELDRILDLLRVQWGLSVLGLALFEQSLKRGYLQSTLGRALGFWRAAWLLSILFALEKLLAIRNPLALTGFLVTGLLACLTLRRTGDLWFAVGLQTGLDWSMVFLFGMGLPFTSLRPPGALMRVDMQGPVWLSGGEDGFYASAFFLGLLVILAWGVQRRFPSPNST